LSLKYVDGKALNPLLFLVYDKMAAASCFPEMFSSIAKLFGAELRCLKFYQVKIKKIIEIFIHKKFFLIKFLFLKFFP